MGGSSWLLGCLLKDLQDRTPAHLGGMSTNRIVDLPLHQNSVVCLMLTNKSM